MIQLIPDARISWRFISVQATLLLGLVSSIQAELFPVLQPVFTPEQWRYILPAWAVLIYVLRLIAQPALEPQRQQLQLDQAEAQTMPGVAADDEEVDGMAMVLYEAGGLSRAWEHVSPESKAKWRTVARAALQRTAPADAGGENF